MLTRESQFSFTFLKISLLQEDEGRLTARHKAPFEGPLKKYNKHFKCTHFVKSHYFLWVDS